VAPQLSVEVGDAQLTTEPQAPGSLESVMSEGTPSSVGAARSVTVMVKLAVVLLPWMSVAV